MSHPSPAYMLSLSVENIRCFGPRQTLDLSDGEGRPARWTIILGENGTGKTTLMECIARMCQASSELDQLSHVTLGRLVRGSSGSIAARVARASSLRGGPFPSEDFALTIHAKQFGEHARLEWKDSLQSRMENGMSCFAYGASRRMGSANLSSTATSSDTTISLLGDAPLINAEEWFLRMDYLDSKQPGAADQLQYTRELLTRVLPEVDDLRVAGLHTNGRRTPRPFVEARTPYGWVRLSELSHGYQTLIAWMVDLVHNLYGLDWELDPLHHPAVVLVDEIDLHLHPTWQRELLSYLSERFPNIQFIATAHSPLIVQAAADANLVLLRREGDHVVIDNSPQSIQGWRVDQILTSDLFGLKSARPPQLERLLAEREAILTQAELSESDESRLAELEAEIGALPFGEDPDEIKARERIMRFAQRLDALESRE